MLDQKPLSAVVHGRFAIVTTDGVEVNLKGTKERALLAMLVLSHGQRRSRAWLQDRLWSRSPPESGAGSLRRVLSNIRRALRPYGNYFHSDRTNVWLGPEIRIASDAPQGAMLLEDIDGSDPEFDDWLTGIRAQAESDEVSGRGPEAPWLKRQARQVTRIRIESDVLGRSADTRFAAENLACRIASRLTTLGPVEIELDHDAREPERGEDIGTDTLIRIQGAPVGDQLQFRARVQMLPSLRYCDSHRATVPLEEIANPGRDELSGLINRTVMTVLDVNAPMGRTRPYYAIQNAVRRLYSDDRNGLTTAEILLKGAQEGEAAGIALAWRAFLRLTDYLEFRQDDPDLAETAVAMSERATRLSPRNAVVWALASQVAIYIGGDHELGMYYARRAEECADDDPYTLDALSGAASVTKDRSGAFMLAERGRRAAEGLDHVYNWDMQCCLSAISVERMDEARRYAQNCHWQAPHYRPALRYLVALNLLNGDRLEARKYAARLRKLEPDFEESMICQDDYPVYTLRILGMVGQIQSTLAA